ncbi:MAG: hypothetical protein PHT54_04155 [Candidatus Nanoarchaeia archaeon]|nr:hypothetical protein [Candidatus Nanoarchaeia archaeon]
MKAELLKEKEMPLLLRKRLNYEIEFENSTPKNDEVKKQIAKAANVSEDLVSIRHIYQKYGETKAKVIANIYKNPEDLKNIEEIKKKKKDGKEKDKKQDSK